MRSIPIFSFFALILGLAGGWYYLSDSFAKRLCPIGHLTPEAVCEMHSSFLSPLGLGWDYSIAKGQIDKKFCPLRGGDQELGPMRTNFLSTPCEDWLENFKGDCLVGQKGRQMVILASDRPCGEGVYFEGRGRTLHAGQPVPLGHGLKESQ